MKIISAIIAIANALPIINSWIEKLMSAWIDKKIEDIQAPYTDKAKQRRYLMKKISKAQTDEERKMLSVILANINNNQL